VMSPFGIDLDGKWIATNCLAKRNHSLCGANAQHLSRRYQKALIDYHLVDSFYALIAQDG